MGSVDDLRQRRGGQDDCLFDYLLFCDIILKDPNGSYGKNDFVGGIRAAAESTLRGNCDLLRVRGVVMKALRAALQV